MKKRVMSIILVLVLAFTCVPIGSIAASASTDYTEPTIFVESKYAAPGSSVKVNVDVKNNPGIAGATLSVSYDSRLTLTAAESGSAFSKLNFTAPGRFDNPSKFLWDSESGQVNDDGIILSLTFKVADDAASNEQLNVNVSYYSGDIYNENLENVNFQTVSGIISVESDMIGDVNRDGKITLLDAILIQKHLVEIVSFDEDTLVLADINKDNNVNMMDAILVQKSVIGSTDPQPQTYNVTFKDYDGTVIKTESVESGKSANAPEAPQREGFIFSKWDKPFDKITSDMVIKAEYTKIVNPTVTVQSAAANAGSTVQIPIKIYNNPGINGMQLNVSYDERLTLTKAENGTALSTLYFTQPGAYVNPSKFLWDGVGDNDNGNGEVLLLAFEIPTDAQPGEEYIIKIEYPEGSIFDSDLNDVNFDIVCGSIKIK